jgi:hypothetical protein
MASQRALYQINSHGRPRLALPFIEIGRNLTNSSVSQIGLRKSLCICNAISLTFV